MRTLVGLTLVGTLALPACSPTPPPPAAYDASGAWTAEFIRPGGETGVLGASITMTNKPYDGDFTMILAGGDTTFNFMYGNSITGELHFYYEPLNIYRGKFENGIYLGALKDDSGKLVSTLRLTRPF